MTPTESETGEPLRVGIVGLDSSHADQYVRLLSGDGAVPGTRITALADSDPGRLDELAAAGGVDVTAEGTAGLLGHCDAVIVGDRDGALHAPHALPALEAGLPVLVDKPFALELGDARAMIEAARASGAGLTSYSPLRRQRETIELCALAARRRPTALAVSGPADPASPYGGLAFYGVHLVELACQLAPGEAAEVAIEHVGDDVVMRMDLGGIPVRIVLIAPGDGPKPPFHVDLEWTDDTATAPVSADVPLPDDYLRPGLAAFVDMARGGRPPLSARELLRPVALLEELPGRR